MYLKSLFSSISICFLLSFSTNSYSGIPPKATPQIDKKINLKRMVSKQCLERIEFMHEQQGGYTGVPTGFKDLDEKTSGLQRSDLIIVAGRPSMGKTSLP